MPETDPAPPPAPGGELPLFPLGTVLFPGGLLPLVIFEARYLDMVSACLRTRTPFGVVALTRGSEVRRRAGDDPAAGDRGGVEDGTDDEDDADDDAAAAGDAPVGFEPVGTLAEIDTVDADRSGVLRIACRGARRFRIESRRQRADGLWLGRTTAIDDDPVVRPEPAMAATVRSLATTIATLKARFGPEVEGRFPSPYRFEDAGWVANRWCELLPMSRVEKQALMMATDPAERLRRVARLLRSNEEAGDTT